MLLARQVVNMIAFILVLIVEMLLPRASPSLLPELEDSEVSVYKCVIVAANRTFMKGGPTLVVSGGGEPNSLYVDLSVTKLTPFLITENVNFMTPFVESLLIHGVKNTLLLVAPKNINDTLHALVSFTARSSNAVYVIVLAHSPKDGEDIWKVIEHHLNRMVMNVNVLMRVNSGFDLLTWIPEKGDGFTFTANLEKIDECRVISGDVMYKNESDLQKPKVPNDFYGRKVIAGMSAQPPFIIKLPGNGSKYYEGLEFRLLNCLADKLNFSWAPKEGGRLLPTGHGTRKEASMFKYLREGSIDLAVSGIPAMRYKYFEEFQPSVLYSSDSNKWYVQNAKRVPSWQLIYQKLPAVFLGCAALAFMMIAATSYMIGNVEFVKAVLASWSVMMDLDFFLPTIDMRTRIFVTLAMVYTMHINIVFKSAFYSNLQHPVFEMEVKTLEDLEMSNITVEVTSGSDVYESLLSDITNRGLKSLKGRFSNCNRTINARNYCFERLKQNVGDYGVVASYRQADFLTKLFYVDSSGTPYVHHLDEVIDTHYIGTYFVKGDPLGHACNRLFVGVVEGALMKRWELLIDHAMKYHPGVKKIINEHSKEDAIRLRFSHLSGAFAALGLGLFLSGVVFLVERTAVYA